MRALQINHYGEDVQIQEVEKPTITSDHLCIEVVAASVNPVDYKIQQGDGKWVLGNKLPLTLGHDFSGIVKEVGVNVQGYQIGDKVFGRAPHTGSFCEYIAVQPNDIAHAPASISLIEAASVPLAALTAWQALEEGLQLQPKQTLLITGGSGGVGSAAIALAHAMGAQVVTTASEQGAAFLAAYHPEKIIDYQTTNFKEVLSSVDAVFDTRGGQTLVDSFSVLKKGGRVATIVSLPTADFAQKIGLGKGAQLFVKVATSRFTRLARKKEGHFYAFFTQSNGNQLQKIAQLIDQNQYPIHIEEQFSMDNGQAAINLVKKGHVKGKVVIVIRPEEEMSTTH